MKWLRRIHLIDKFLLVFMLIFMLQSGFTLFKNHTPTQEANTIDVIIRTSAAAIFGYFISANFVRRDSLKKVKPVNKSGVRMQKDNTEKKDIVTNKIGFTLPGAETPLIDGGTEYEETEEKKEEISSHLQIVITAIIGIVSLCLLLLYRDFFEMSPSGASTVSQLRDFVSGCVGFLIGGTTSRSGTK